MERLILGCTNQNDLVLDPFCGSGTTALSAKLYGRNYYTIDNNEEYVELTKKRLKGFKFQQSLAL